MSLHDVDKNTDNRTLPAPNTSDSLQQRLAHNTMSTSYKDESDANNQRIVFKNNLIMTYDSEDRVSSVYGYIPEISDIPLFIIANEGYDVFEDILGITAPTV